jgi:hypothetical protein
VVARKLGDAMSFNALIANNLRLAFKLLKDRAVEAVFSVKQNATFDFATSDVTVTSTNKTVKCVELESKQRSDSMVVKMKTILFETPNLPDASAYDTVVLDGKTWSFTSPTIQNRFVTVVDIYLKE